MNMDQQVLANEFTDQLRQDLGNQRLLGPDDLKKLAVATGRVVGQRVDQLEALILRVAKGLQKLATNQRNTTGNLDALVSALDRQTAVMSQLLNQMQMVANSQQAVQSQPRSPRRFEITHSDGKVSVVADVSGQAESGAKDDDLLPHPEPLNLPHPCP
jgi:hypothetical protein